MEKEIQESQTTLAQNRFMWIAFWQLAIGYNSITALSGHYTRGKPWSQF